MNSIRYLAPYFQVFPIFQDLCSFIDYLNTDSDSLYSDIRYKYVDFEKLSSTAILNAFHDLGADYIVDILKVMDSANANQLLGIVSLVQLLKGQLKGVDLIAEILGFTYTAVAWHELSPLNKPNTATFIINLSTDITVTSTEFKNSLQTFLKKYLYPEITLQDVIFNYKSVPTIEAGFCVGNKVKVSFTEIN